LEKEIGVKEIESNKKTLVKNNETAMKWKKKYIKL
jgi:hypothetical protein